MMGRPKPAPHLSDYVADRAQVRGMNRMFVQANTCPGCRTVYVTHAHSVTCENWHKRGS